MIVVMVMITALLAAGAVVVILVTSDTRAAGDSSNGRKARACADGGLAAARAIVRANDATWPMVLDLDGTNDPVWYPIRGYLDDAVHGAGDPFDYEVTLRDDHDEVPPAADDPTVDTNLNVIAVARCLRYPDVPVTVHEIVADEAAVPPIRVYRNAD
jgi:hypothetical protein